MNLFATSVRQSFRSAKLLDDFSSARSFEEFAKKWAGDKAGELSRQAVNQGLDKLMQGELTGGLRSIDAALGGLNPQGSSQDLARQNALQQEKFALQFGGQMFDVAKAGDAGREGALNKAVGTPTRELKPPMQDLNTEIGKRMKDPAAANDPRLADLQVNVQNDIKMMQRLAVAGKAAKGARPALEFAAAGAAVAAGIVKRRGMKERVVQDKNGKPCTIYGQSGSSSTTPGHAEAIEKKAQELAESGEYESVLMQRSWRTATGREAKGKDARKIPDLIGIRRDGTVDAWEVQSDSDDRATLERRLDQGMRRVPVTRRAGILGGG